MGNSFLSEHKEENTKMKIKNVKLNKYNNSFFQQYIITSVLTGNNIFHFIWGGKCRSLNFYPKKIKQKPSKFQSIFYMQKKIANNGLLKYKSKTDLHKLPFIVFSNPFSILHGKSKTN